MKGRFYFVFIVAAFLSCKKDKPVNTDEVRLLKVKRFADNNNAFYSNIEYNPAGKVSAITQNKNNEAPAPFATITYNGNEVTIQFPPVQNNALSFVEERKFILNSAGQPISRTRSETQEYFASPGNNAQRTFITDTTLYEYDAAGLISKTSLSFRDSTWLQPPGAPASTNTALRKITDTYTNTNGNVVLVTGQGTEFNRASNGQAIITTNNTIELKTTYSYANNYPNKTDFTNAAVLMELGIFPFPSFPLNKNYQNMPEKAVFEWVTRDAGGNPVQVLNSTNNYNLSFNRYNFLSGVSFASSPGFEFIYNK
jgi:hypothetical protein